MRKLQGRHTKLVAAGLLALSLTGCGGETTTHPVASKGEFSAVDDIPAPEGRSVLSVSGLISKSNSKGGVRLDLKTLERMPQVEATVYEPFLKKRVSFTGVMMEDFLELVGADANAEGVRMVALDDYQVDLPMTELKSSTVLLATRQDGRRINLKSGGPSRIIFLTDTGLGSNGDMWIWSVESMQVHG